MEAQTVTLQKLHSKKIEQYFNMRKSLTTASDKDRRAIEKASGKLFSEIVELGAKVYPSQHYSQF
tara:strand:+ start:1456 stop:1650 length:195 start_codon:yes stop_codon:yes gene_type:complete